MLTLPPGPRDGRLEQTVRFHRDPLGFLREQRDAFGDVFTIRLAVAGPAVVVAAREAIPAVVGTDPRRGHGGEARQRVLGMVSPRSVLGADGAQHHAARSRVEAAFAPAAIDARREAIARLTRAHVASWPRGRPTRLLPRARALADEIFVRLILGVRDDARVAALILAIRRMLYTPGYPPLPPPGEGAGALGAVGKRLFDRRCEPVRRPLAEEIEERHAGGAAELAPPDLIDCMVGGADPLDRDAAIDQLLPLLMAGQEPPACALAWLLDRVGREPGEAAVFLEDGDGLAAARDRFVRETLRVRPPVHSVMRRLTAPLDVPGFMLPAGAVAMVPMALVHRDPVAFPEPNAFRPERWERSPDETPYLPFGGGARRCLGEPLAHALIETALPLIAQAVRIEPLRAIPERMVVRGTVTAAHRSLLARVTSR